MKKLLSVVLCILLVCTVFAGCKNSSPEEIDAPKNSSPAASSGKPLRLCADFGLKGVNPSGGQEYALETFLRSVADRGGPTDIEIELIPGSGSERQTALNRIRVELMSGQGPDIFIANCADSNSALAGQALFQFPEQAMKRGLFLKLDDYIENAQFMEWDKLTPAVMDAGRTEDGQYLLPLSYSFPLSIFLADDVQPYPVSTTWAQVAEGNDPILSTSMDPLLDAFLMLGHEYNYFSYTWKELADYDSETLLISEEELLQRAKEVISLRENGADTPFPHFRSVMDHYLLSSNVISSPELNEAWQGITRSDSMTMIPLYCDQGGAVAAVHTFAGINANTERSEDAFFVLDVLFLADLHKNLSLYDIWTMGEMPVHEGVSFGQPENVLTAFGEARSQIVSARFVTPLDALINNVLYEYQWRKSNENATEEDLDELLRAAYSDMKKVLDES